MRQATDETTTTTLPRPKTRRRPLRINVLMRDRLEAAVNALIETLDALDAPEEDKEDDDPGGDGGFSECDDEDGGDDEPSLGSIDSCPNIGDRLFKDGTYSQSGLDQTNWASGTRDDREDEHDGSEPDEDGEPILGSCDNIMDQRRWSEGTSWDYELADDTQEGEDNDDLPWFPPTRGDSGEIREEATNALRRVLKRKKIAAAP